MSKSNAYESSLQKLIYQAVPIAGLADNAASSPITNIYYALHTADPGDAGNQSTNEVSYTGYARAAVPRTTSGHTETNGSISPAATISFPAGTGGGGTAMFFSTGLLASGVGTILHKGVLGTFQGAFTAATSGTITAPGHTMAVGDRVAFFSIPGTSLPTGITEGQVYYVLTAATDTLTISATSGGSAVAITAAGDGLVYKDVGIALGNGITPQLGTGTTIVED